MNLSNLCNFSSDLSLPMTDECVGSERGHMAQMDYSWVSDAVKHSTRTWPRQPRSFNYG